MRRSLSGVVALFFLGTATVFAAHQSSIRCSDWDDSPETKAPGPDWAFVAMDKGTFHSVFRHARQSSFGQDVFFATRKDRPEGRSWSQSATLMLGVATKDQKFYRLVDEKGAWPVYEGPMDELSGVPEIARVTNDPSGPIFLVTIKSRMHGGNTNYPIDEKLIVALRPKPRIDASIDCTGWGGGGACTAFDAMFTTSAELQCDWSRPLRNYVCTSTRAYPDIHWMTHPSVRRFALIGGKSLPVTRPGMPSFASLQEFSERLRIDDSLFERRVMIEGVGLLAPLNIPLPGVPLYAAPGRSDDMDLRVFAFPRDGAPISVPLHEIVDGQESEEKQRADDNLYTPTGEDWSTVVAGRINLPGAEVFSIVMYDGKGRGLFWLAIDQTAKPPMMSSLRVAADVGPYDHCNTFIYPASASAVTVTGDHADLTIEPHSRRGEEGEAKKWEGDAELPCHVRGTVTWDHEKGFILLTSDVPCEPNEVRVGVVIDALGHLSTTPLRYEKEQ